MIRQSSITSRYSLHAHKVKAVPSMTETAGAVRFMTNRNEVGFDDVPAQLLKLVLHNDATLKHFHGTIVAVWNGRGVPHKTNNRIVAKLYSSDFQWLLFWVLGVACYSPYHLGDVWANHVCNPHQAPGGLTKWPNRLFHRPQLFEVLPASTIRFCWRHERSRHLHPS